MSAREWQPGDVAYHGHPDSRMVIPETAACSRCDVRGEAPIPLVVIDPDRVLVDGGFDANHLSPDSLLQILTNVANHLDENDDVPAWVDVLRALSSAIAPTPPKPDEPTGLGAVVEDADNHRWTRANTAGEWFCECGDEVETSWGDVKAVRILSEGVPS